MVDNTALTNADKKKEFVQPFVDISYCSLYCSDIIKSAMWYQKHFGCKLLSCNPHFGTIQLSPGRIMFLNRNAQVKEVNFIVTEIGALKEHLNSLGAAIEDNDDTESEWFCMKDLDGNHLEIWCGDRFGCNGITYQYDSWVEQFNNVLFEEKEEIHALGVLIGTTNLTNLTEKLLSACTEMSVTPKINNVFTLVKPDQSELVFGCIELTGPSLVSIPTGFEYIYIPPQLYSISTFSNNDAFRETYTERYTILGHYTLYRPTDPSYIVENYYDNGMIQSYLPVAYHTSKL